VIARARRRRVRPSTVIGREPWLTVAVASEMSEGLGTVADFIEAVEWMIARGALHWAGRQNRLVMLDATADGEVLH
jgi:hypothetical protein